MMGLPPLPNDPYLEFQPAFAYSLPIQILLTGITLTLLVILLIHLLSPLNYCLQLASVIAVLLGVIVRVYVILSHLGAKGDRWPYTLDYVAVPVPQPKWNQAQDAAWQTLLAISNGLANITHIQFLTLLYPSRTEARLIFVALGPLAIASSALYYCTLSNHSRVIDMGDAIRAVFSCTLLVIFSLALFIWGFLVNRGRAWRLDGGTAVFGSGALGLALVTTASSFVAVKEEELVDWLQHLIWAAVLWQTWLGWWWWVGAGMGIGEVEDIMERSLRKRRKAARRAHAKQVMAAANEEERPRRQQTVTGAIKSGTTAVVGFTSSLVHLRSSAGGSAPGSAASAAGAPGGSVGGGSLSRLRIRRARPRRDVEEGVSDGEVGEVIELGTIRLEEPLHHSENSGASGGRQPPSSNSNSGTSSTSRTPSLHAPRSVGEFVAYPATWLQVYIRRLRKAHEDATRRRAVEQAERRARVPNIAASADDGWGLGSFGADRQLRVNALLEEDEGKDDDDEGDEDDDEGDDVDQGPVRQPRNSARGSAQTSRRNSLAHPRSLRETREAQTQTSRVAEEHEHADEGEWEDVTSDEGPRRRGSVQSRSSRVLEAQRAEIPARPGVTGSSWSWWGPLRDWRLQDRSTF
ncbi:hypothetical protein CcaverHIS002_0207750 [Cutaneotrichosporon cavernicola]|uniref:PalH-domain-containing protein n=1 Tax=Cutaneotrichosporon cavernicola TaxID=279322 RepID=A0AA48I4Y2_9TREE|nr:uncharacterized protein CcaverHIS019_0207740 [Cutaneotrichosporon cavernicola]BEI81615.1 hypothetical protein CcaverHIS002_0207750 [Cutaneotrichosporon cavernicola]BEI89412.1 hypothetical protein CcaverHIS019_0207740 [Cutaneotrichosporon cavernicola]BEI97186.1 hypothetical protein CcaverHIS631_0207750 [Cutaneotrichosporon cavernicola]BEJ04959.1 hypothetical protein CcaverHIS641_0207760 [Cutaneotrichosporon cavernicola]